MAEVASAYVSLLPSAKGFGSKLDAEVGGDLDKSGKTSGKRFGTALKAGALAAMAGGVVVAKFLGDAVGAASDLAENQSKVGVVFGKSAAQIIKASKSSATAMGLSQNAYLGATGTLGNLLVSLDIAPKKAANMSQEMVKLAGDLASFNNVSPEEALEALKSGLTGETEPLKRFGVNMNDATLKAQALKDGLIKNTKEALTPQTKALAAQALIMDQTKTAQGDFARTSGGLANQQRILAAQVDDVKTKVGKFLLPVLTNVVSYVNKNVVPAFSKFVDQMQNGEGAGGKFVDAIGDIKDGLQNAFDTGKKLFDMFNSLPSGLKKAIGIAAGGALIASKVPGGKGAVGAAVKGITGGGVQKVFVTNPGFGAGGGMGAGGGGKSKVVGGVAAVGLGTAAYGAAQTGNSFFKSIGAAQDSVKGIEAIAKALRASNVGKYAKDLGIDVSRLAEDISKYGERGTYVAEVQRKLDKNTDGLGGKVHQLGDFLSPLTGKTEKAGLAQLDLGTISRRTGKSLDAAAGSSVRTAGAAQRLAKDVFGTGIQLNRSGLSAKDYGQKLRSLPKGVQTRVTTPGAVTSRADVQGLKRQFDLTPKQVRTLIQLTGAGAAIASASHLKSIYDNMPKYIETQAITRHIDKFERVGRNAKGTDFWRGGPTWVGEKGPEILNLPRGSQIIPNHRIGEATRGGSTGGSGRPIIVNDRSGNPRQTAREVVRLEAFAGGA